MVHQPTFSSNTMITLTVAIVFVPATTAAAWENMIGWIVFGIFGGIYLALRGSVFHWPPDRGRVSIHSDNARIFFGAIRTRPKKWLLCHQSSRRVASVKTLIYLSFIIVISLAPQYAAGDIADEIRAEATRSNQDTRGRPLPLMSHWNSGKHPLSEGWGPKHQIDLIEQGHYLLPWFAFPTTFDIPSWQIDFTTYYESAIMRARDLNLPLVFVGTQWEQALYREEPYISLPASETPNVVTTAGDILLKVSPFGPVEHWESLGNSLTNKPWFDLIQEWYPNPPAVFFLSNNEAQNLRWRDAETSARYVSMYGTGRSDDFKRQVFGDSWIPRYRAMQDGMRAGLTNSTWRDRVQFIAYEASGPRHIGRWGGWAEYSLTTTGRVDPNPLIWDGGGASYYTDNWNELTDFKGYSPQVEAQNLVFQIQEGYTLNPEFWLEMSIWDGHIWDDPSTDKWMFYESLGQTYTPERYAGYTTLGMWMLRPRVVRDFRGWTEEYAGEDALGTYFMANVAAVDKVHTNVTLRDFWRTGELVPNRAHQHFYQSNFPAEYEAEDRWFLLDANVNDDFPWEFTTEIPVFSLALLKGVAPNREWLVYGHAPLGDIGDVWLTIPEYKDVLVDIAVGGSYYLVDEATGTIQEVTDVSPPPPPPPNAAPVANAGLNKTVLDSDGLAGEIVTLNGSGSSDSDGTVVSYVWAWTGGSANGVNPTVNLPDGTTVVTLTVTDNDGAADTDSVSVTVEAPPSEVEVTFVSIASEDGWVRESNENSNLGGRTSSRDPDSRALRTGDDNRDRQYKFILSFDTSTLPDGADIQSAVLKLSRGGTNGTNPFTTHGSLRVDIQNGSFGKAGLENSDFEAPASATGIATTNGADFSAAFNATGVSSINKAGRTQLRLYFDLDDNDDGGNDYAGIYSSDNRNSSRHPRLIVTYSIP